jgi:predicted DNA-binding antitoxin AbrB/MazE fold protein
MDEIFRATFQKGVFVPLQDVGLREKQVVRLQIIPAQVKIGAAFARQKVNRFLLDEVSYMLGADQPALIENDHFVWRAPILFTSPERGVIGLAGTIDVDAETGELLVTGDTVAKILQNARDLAGSTPSEAAPSI